MHTPTRRARLALVASGVLLTAAPVAARAATPTPTPDPTASVASATGTASPAASSSTSGVPVATTTPAGTPAAAPPTAAPSPAGADSSPVTSSSPSASTSAAVTSQAASTAPVAGLLVAPTSVSMCQGVALQGTTTAGTTVRVERLVGSVWTVIGQPQADASGSWSLVDHRDECYAGTTNYRATAADGTTATATVSRSGAAPTYALATSQDSHTSTGTFRGWGPVRLTGSLSVPAVTTVTVWRMTSDLGTATRLTTATTDATGAFTITLSMPATDGYLFVDSGRGASNQRSALVPVPSGTPRLTLVTHANLDALSTGQVQGTVTPVPTTRLRIIVQVYRNGVWKQAVQGATAADGSYSLPYTPYLYKDMPGTYRVRAAVTQPDGSLLWSPSNVVTRSASLRATVRDTTAADVVKTYRAGCPVGPASLRTIDMNFLGYDGVLRRGQLIVRRDLATRVVTAFQQGLAGRFPLKSLNNPNVYGGDDVTMMRAGNTSAFNCRHVTGNPYAMSPHSYGKAIDVNTIENPYRDPAGRWYPSTAYSVNRPASVTGLLTSTSSLTVGLRGQSFSWFSGWDWQHFEAK